MVRETTTTETKIMTTTTKTTADNFTRDDAKRAAAILSAALAKIEKETGYVFTMKGATRFDATGASAGVQILKRAADGSIVTREENDFRAMANALGVDVGAFGREFESNGSTFRLSGLKPSGRRFPFLAVRVRDGKTFKFSVETIARKFPRPSAGATS